MMRLVVATVQDDAAPPLLSALTIQGFRATRIGGTGGPLRAGTATVLIGVAAERVPTVLGLIAEVCQAVGAPPTTSAWYSPDPDAGGSPAHVSVLNVARFERL
jgi:uncharacterized protein YaaQ